MISKELSGREKEILLLVCAEMSAEEIGEKLSISPCTVYTHRKNILAKTGSKNKIGLVKYAIRKGMI
ncbi:MAG: helix-turn-helix transcriptional regulator [Bacteroidetes bacterium]|nr:helix-turn-helix transcriptional regulator [Bacteroidota bacterium]